MSWLQSVRVVHVEAVESDATASLPKDAISDGCWEWSTALPTQFGFYIGNLAASSSVRWVPFPAVETTGMNLVSLGIDVRASFDENLPGCRLRFSIGGTGIVTIESVCSTRYSRLRQCAAERSVNSRRPSLSDNALSSRCQWWFFLLSWRLDRHWETHRVSRRFARTTHSDGGCGNVLTLCRS